MTGDAASQAVSRGPINRHFRESCSRLTLRVTELSPRRQFWPNTFAVAIGTLITLVVSGYQFGRGNHTVYLLEGLRIADPTLFRNDWFVTSTLQYHAVFSWFTAMMMRLGLLEPAFLAG